MVGDEWEFLHSYLILECEENSFTISGSSSPCMTERVEASWYEIAFFHNVQCIQVVRCSFGCDNYSSHI